MAKPPENSPPTAGHASQDLLIELIDSKLEHYAPAAQMEELSRDLAQRPTRKEVNSLADAAVMARIKSVQGKMKWFMIGVGSILALLAIDAFTWDAITRKALRALTGVETYVKKEGPGLVDDYIGSTAFLRGSYTYSEAIVFDGCEQVDKLLSFQADLTRHRVFAEVIITMPDDRNSVILKPWLNNYYLGDAEPKPLQFGPENKVSISLDITDKLNPENLPPSQTASLQEFWVQLELVRNKDSSSEPPIGSGPGSGVRTLEGLPDDTGTTATDPDETTAAATKCVVSDRPVWLRMLLRVVGDPRVDSKNPVTPEEPVQ